MLPERVKTGIKHLVYGIIYGIIMYFVYAVLFPLAFSKLGLPIQAPSFKGVLLGFLAFFIVLEAFASALKGTVYGFVLKSLSKLFGLLVFVYVLNNGVISGETMIGGSTVYFSLDLSPIIAAMVILTFPFILLDVMQIMREAAA